ncbi:MAG: hypothetical protein B7Y11_12995 [Sphingobacteriia bacterium 24-36-13]|jgi:hypothetical protein|uniref:hypothetical protein n=1 Tax=Sediminibacterium sp. TaxID=1917865 RepID=UPI000BD9C706|nr:hypothetical protein [Sediminibacterium sp.]OYY08069.1 MAG: hypothetical protein B7Y66_11645 [Sphingobacteriia bacterium 35-36-14]OYZ51940.1 MAG: hypothetical protein B7Y11_12995 [Sphingobacteriia bacterium 24-36-13]OZA62657.1 MAG: hypothetical protein B7X68_13075 [Sphingobacteriia bacterium 39-36-14]HQS25085.1 hypothetical protein [Sediminibacterium sp.]HQS35281.1 hypothetical protein [Sediminibacterium sp.]
MKKMTTPIAIVFMILGSVIGFNNATAQMPATAAEKAAKANHKYAKDVSSENNIIAALYNVICGAPGESRDWERFKYLFGNDAKLIPTGKVADGGYIYRTMTPEEYVTMFSTRIKTGFFEKELKRETVSFGTVVHAFSTYETRETENGPSTNRGINSIQLFKDQDRYYIVNIFWCAESMGFTLPASALK